MTLLNSAYSQKVKSSYQLGLGNIFFFENILISEINEGKHVNYNEALDYRDLIEEKFNDKPFIYISNRVNQFSVNIMDFEKFCDTFPNMKAFITVYYNQFTYKGLAFEKQFCKIPYLDFKTVKEAYKFSVKELKVSNKNKFPK